MSRPPLPAHRARKRFGQNFLHDPRVIERIVRAIDPKPDQTLIEIGPGLGALTRPLLERSGSLQVVEIDRDVVPHLETACADLPGLTIHLADALAFDYGALASAEKPLRLIGNLPYNISTPLLFHLFGFAGQVRDMHFMLQKEVVDRICAAPGSDDYGRLTVTLAARADAAMLFTVGPGAFHPAPQVDSAIVRIRPRPAPFPLPDPQAYDRLVTAAFSQRRKTLSNSIKSLLSAPQIAAIGIDPSIRAERLAPTDFAHLTLEWLRNMAPSTTP